MKPVQDYLEHFAPELSQEIIDYANDVMLKESRYIFVTTKKKQQYGYCTHCNSEFRTHLPKPTEEEVAEVEQCGCHAGMFYREEYEKAKHGDKMTCPVCKSECKVRYSGLGHSKLSDIAYFVYYDKSILDPKVIVARGIVAYRDYTTDYKNVETKFACEYEYVFVHGKGGKMIKWINSWNKPPHIGFAKSVYSRMRNQAPSTEVGCSIQSIKRAVKNTPFAWSGWEQYSQEKYDDMVTFFDLFSRYPVVEYLNKLGHKRLVNDKLRGHNTLNTINWRGKSLLEVLKLTQQEYQITKQQNIELNFWFLRLIKLNREKSLDLTVTEVNQLSQMIYGEGELDTICIMTSLEFKFRDAFKYIVKQYEKNKRAYYSASSVIKDWQDYKKDCIKLGIDISDERVLFPRNLHKAHQDTTKKIKYLEDQELNEKIKKRLPKLTDYCFNHSGLFIRPAESSLELIDEGKALSHCVGGYSKDYAEERTDILFIRKESEPDKPYYTMEIKNGRIIQTRGLRNCVADEKVTAFVEAFKENVLTGKLKRKKSKIAIPA